VGDGVCLCDAVSNAMWLTMCYGYVTPENYGGALRCITLVRYSSVLHSHATACMCVCVHASHPMCHIDTFAWRQHASTHTSQCRNNK